MIRWKRRAFRWRASTPNWRALPRPRREICKIRAEAFCANCGGCAHFLPIETNIMAFRRIVIVLLIVGGFAFLTTLNFSPLRRELTGNSNLASHLSLTEIAVAGKFTAQRRKIE